MNLLHSAAFILTITFTFIVYVSQVQGGASDKPSNVSAVYPTETPGNERWREDDHLDTTPEAAERRLESLTAEYGRQLR